MDIQTQANEILSKSDFGVIKAFNNVMAVEDQGIIVKLHKHIGRRLAEALFNLGSIKPIIAWISEDLNYYVNLYPTGDGMACVALFDRCSTSKGLTVHDYDDEIKIKNLNEWIKDNVQNPQNALQ